MCVSPRLSKLICHVKKYKWDIQHTSVSHNTWNILRWDDESISLHYTIQLALVFTRDVRCFDAWHNVFMFWYVVWTTFVDRCLAYGVTLCMYTRLPRYHLHETNRQVAVTASCHIINPYDAISSARIKLYHSLRVYKQ